MNTAMKITIQDSAIAFHSNPIPAGFQECLQQLTQPLTKPNQIYLATILGEITTAQTAFAQGTPPAQLEETKLLQCIQSTWDADIPVTTINTACTSGAAALVSGACYLHGHPDDTVLVIAFEEKSTFNTAGFTALRVLDTTTRPFTTERNGFHLAPAISMACLTRQQAPLQISGFSISNDAHHPTGPHRTGDGIKRCIEDCLRQCQLQPDEISCIKLNGTGTVYSDEAEYRALENVFGPHLPAIPIFFYKSVLGHLQGATGLVETLMAMKTIEQNIVPALSADIVEHMAFDLNVATQPRKQPLKNGLLIYSGIGGHNVCLLVQRPKRQKEC